MHPILEHVSCIAHGAWCKTGAMTPMPTDDDEIAAIIRQRRASPRLIGP